MNKNIIIAIIVIIVLVLGGWFLYAQYSKAPATEEASETPNTQTGAINNPDQNNPVGGIDANVEVNTAKTYEVVYTAAGFSPATLTINKGDTVTFKNQSSSSMWVGSAMHPTHTAYSGTTLQQHCPDPENNDFDQCKAEGPGTSWSFTFTKTGTWSYHNHMNSSKFGKIIVQ